MTGTGKIAFASAFSVIIFGLVFYYLFANRIEPIVLGLPFSLFFITLLIVVEFALLVLLYRLEQKNGSTGKR